ncbi:MAG TPA: amino acid adenylation domain-containing protein, partial [Blastocatellia bacterium]|nr:amino acid adenylation domain-containing protein [Blastocatellia bacterium]
MKRHLRERLPGYMVPEAIVMLNEMPVTANGKIDRRRLPGVEKAGRQVAERLVAARTPVEEILVGIFKEVLKQEEVGVHDNFFEIGGHSLLATRVVSRLRTAFGVEFGVRSIFGEPTVAGLARKVEEVTGAGLQPERFPIVRCSRDGRLPLSFAQQRLWFLDQLAPNNPYYNCLEAVRFEGKVDLQLLARAINEVVRRHEVLRTRIEVENGVPAQVIEEWRWQPLEVESLTDLTPAEREESTRRVMKEQAAAGFDLSTGPLLRVKVLEFGGGEDVAFFTMHHIVSDAWSMGILVREICTLYEAISEGRGTPLPELEIQYADYAVWQRNYLTGEVLEEEVAYWKQQLRGAAVLELPSDYARPAVPSHRGGSERVEIDRETSELLKRLSRRTGATLFMVLMAAFKVILTRYTGEEDLSVGMAIANRTRSEVEGLIGFFVNTLTLRTGLGGNPSFRELIDREREAALAAYAHQEVPFEKLVEEIKPERDLSRNPLFQVMMVFQNMGRAELAIKGLKLQRLETEPAAAKFDLNLILTEEEESIAGRLEYSRDLYREETVRRIVGHYRQVLEEVSRDADRRIRQLELMNRAERDQIVRGWNETDRAYGERLPVHEMIRAQAVRRAEAIAVKSEQGELSYRELDRRANQLAHYLKERGIGREDLVGICAERSLEMVIAILGILKAGAAYVPIDPEDPKQRLEYVLEDSGVKLLLAQERLLGELGIESRRLVRLDRDWGQIESCSGEAPEREVGEDGLAYAIYTSGSTGRPKGAMNTQAGIRNRLLWMQERYGLDETDRVLQKTTFSFDVSVWEFLWPLMTGAALVMARAGGHKDSEYLLKTIRREEITTIHFVPSMLEVFLEEPIEEAGSLRRVICSGEALAKSLEHRFLTRTAAQLSNLYGPTEAAIDVTCWICERDGDRQTVPIGKPIANTRMYVLDPELEAIPIGITGDLYISGAGLARGYVGRPELTAEKFIPSRFGGTPGGRMYRTGDLARYLPDGNIEYIGREDAQVKIRGYRVELGEIEAALNEHPAVRQSVVVARRDEGGGPCLLGYAVNGAEVTAAELKRHLRERLPGYMVPEAIVMLNEMPVTANGKIDRRR